MKLSNFILTVGAGAAGFSIVRKILDKYKIGIYYFDKEEMAQEEDSEAQAMDLRGTPTHECICGSKVFNLPVSFENFEISTYFLEMQCVECGSIYTAPTPLDRERME